MPDNGTGTDIRRGMETGYPASASRYYELNAEQVKQLEDVLGGNVSWRYTNTCASWASETVQSITGQRINADDTLGLETPRQLIDGIQELERKQKSSPDAPIAPNAAANSSSLGAASPPPTQSMEEALQAQLARFLDDPERQRAWAAQVETHRIQLAAHEAPHPDARDSQIADVGRA